MNILQATKSCLRKYVTFSGRASRSEYWWFFVAILLFSLMGALIDSFVLGIDNSIDTGPVEGAAGLLTFLPSLSAAVRRLHDTGKPWYYILVPIIASGLGALIAVLVMPASFAGLAIGGLIGLAGVLFYLYWLVKPSDPGPNQFGLPPHGVQNYGEVFE